MSTRSKAPQSKALQVSDTSVTTSVTVESIDRDTLTIPHKDEFLAALGYSEDDDIYFRLLPAKGFDATNPEHRKIFPNLFYGYEKTNDKTGEVTQEYTASKEKLKYRPPASRCASCAPSRAAARRLPPRLRPRLRATPPSAVRWGAPRRAARRPSLARSATARSIRRSWARCEIGRAHV